MIYFNHILERRFRFHVMDMHLYPLLYVLVKPKGVLSSSMHCSFIIESYVWFVSH